MMAGGAEEATYIMPCLLKAPSFSAWFDNITILRKVGERDSMDLWAVHRSLELGAG
jgi:hypothetical protein